MGRYIKITEEQYSRINEDGVYSASSSSDAVNKYIEAPRDKAGEAANQAQGDTTITGIKFTKTNEGVVSKKDFISDIYPPQSSFI